MNIHFYLNNEEETPITSFYDLECNPFKLSDIVNLNVEELYPRDTEKYKEDFKQNMFKNQKELEDNFKRKKIKLVKEGKWLNLRLMSKNDLTIEYHCELIS